MGEEIKKVFSVILVDDEIWALRGLKGIADWSAYGFDVCGEFTDPLRAINAIREKKPDLIFTDIRMPGMDGMSLIETLKSEGIDSNIVIVTAYKDFEIARKALKHEVSDYLIKPLDKVEVRETLSKLYADLCLKNKDSFDILNYDLSNRSNLQNPLVYKELTHYIDNQRFRILAGDSDLHSLFSNVSNRAKEIYIKKYKFSYIVFNAIDSTVLNNSDTRIGLSRQYNSLDNFDSILSDLEMTYNGNFFFSENDQTAKIQEYLYQNMTEKVSMDDVSGHFFLSKSYLFELFRNNAGTSAMNFLKNIRLEKATTLLKDSHTSVREVAIAVGFDDCSYFGKSFKNKYGCTPEQYAASNN